jgi:8-oxo-dGTP pyrophosphatase MutT (NUDIX family)
MPAKKIKIISSKILYKGQWLTVRQDNFIKPDGTTAVYEVVSRKNLVVIVPFDGTKLQLVQQYRYASDQISLEFPQGFIEANEEPIEAAKRELTEEIGAYNPKISLLGEIWTSSGFLEQKLHIFKADSYTKGSSNPDSTETDLKVTDYSINQVEDLINKGSINNSPSIAAFALYKINKN